MSTTHVYSVQETEAKEHAPQFMPQVAKLRLLHAAACEGNKHARDVLVGLGLIALESSGSTESRDEPPKRCPKKHAELMAEKALEAIVGNISYTGVFVLEHEYHKDAHAEFIDIMGFHEPKFDELTANDAITEPLIDDSTVYVSRELIPDQTSKLHTVHYTFEPKNSN